MPSATKSRGAQLLDQDFQMAEVEPCRFPQFDVGETSSDSFLDIKHAIELADELKRLGNSNSEALAGRLRTAWAVVLGCYTGLDSVCFGYAETNPGQNHAGHVSGDEIIKHSEISCIDLSGDCSVRDVISRERRNKLGALLNHGTGLFNTCLILENGNSLFKQLDQNRMKDLFEMDEREVSASQIYLVIDLSSLTLSFHWQGSFMTREQAHNIASTFEKVVSETVADENVKISELDYFSDRNQKQVLAWNSNPKGAVKRCIHEVISEQGARKPRAEAVCAWDGSLSYEELLSFANRLAARLVRFGVGPEVFVPLCFDKSKWTIVAMIAVLKAGGIFVPLDPTHPIPRLQALAHKVEAKVVLCSRHHVDMLTTVASKLIPVDGQLFSENDEFLEEDTSRGAWFNGAYMIFTSGTTGEPKGALLEHGSLLSSALAHGPAMLMDSNTRSLQFAASTFDVSITEILTCLILGGCVCIPSEEARLNDIEGAIVSLRANWALLTPTFVKFINPADVPCLKTLVTGGEAMTQAIIRSWQHINLINCYGPAETAVVSHVHPYMKEGKNPLNIGRQVGIHCWVVDRYNHNRLMPVGAVGELVIEGNTCAREYYKEPDKTADAFITDPLWVSKQDIQGGPRRMYKTGDLVRYNSDGSFHIAGRKDTQIKFHGQRIELGEIEHHLNVNQNIKHGMVILPKTGFCKGRLLTMVQLCDALNQDLVPHGRPYELISGELAETAATKVAETKQFLSERLPPYMIPSVWLPVEFIPRLQSGKLDRKQTAKWVDDMSEDLYRRLNPTAASASSENLSFATETELELRSIWSHVLNLKPEQVGLRQSFLSLGGDSISAMQVMSECRKRGIGLTVRNVIGCKSITDLASQVKAIDTPLYHEEIVEQDFDISPIQHLYFSRAGHENGHYNQSFLLRTNRRIMAAEMRTATEAVIQRHSMLRARFSQNSNGEWKQRVTNEIASSYRLRTLKVGSREEVDSELVSSQTCLDEVSGPMFAADLIDVGGEEQLLFVVAHHLVIDLVSWRVILQDIEELLQRPEAAEKMEKPLPYQTWCKLQLEHCMDSTPEMVLPIKGIPDGNAEYWGMVDRPNIYGEMACEGFEIDSVLTSMLLGPCHAALRTEIPDILMASMIHSFGQTFTDRPIPPIFAEGHGRESWDSAIDLSNVVGWFTTIYPVYIGDEASKDPANTVKLVKDARRKVPDKGRPYFASRWLTKQGNEAFARHWPLEITFNYLGQYQQLEREGALFSPAKDIAGEVRDARDGADIGPNTPCISFFEVSAVILKGALRFSFVFNQNMNHQASIRRWISCCQENLRYMLEDLVNLTPQLTPSDFPLLSLDYDRLDLMSSEKLPAAGVLDTNLVEDIYPCSPMQSGLLVSTAKSSAFYAAYTLHEVVPRDGRPVDTEKLTNAWKRIVRYHPILRTIFIESVSQHDSLYDQVVLKDVNIPLVHSHCQTDDESIQSLSLPPLHQENDGKLHHRFAICSSSSGKVYCRLDISHAIMDGTSLSIVFRDLAMAYEGLLGDGDGPLYSNYIAHLQKQPTAPGIDYWRQYLSNVEPCHFPVLDDSNLIVSKELRYVRVNFSELTALQGLCDELGVTISNAIYTAWALTLQCYVNSTDVCFGYLTSARDASIDGIQDVVGPVINMLACRVNISETTTLKDMMSQVQKDYLDSLSFRHVPLAEVQHALHLSNTALFNTALSYRKLPPTPAKEPMINFTECAPTYDPDEYNVSINIEAGEKDMAIDLMYWTDTLSDEQAKNVASTFTQSLSNILHHFEVPVSQLDYLSKRNKEQITQWNGHMPVSVEDCVHNIIYDQNLLRPMAPAIASWDKNFTYAELDEASAKFAKHLVGQGVGVESFVLICFEKSAFTIVAMLAVLKAGGVCVPLDPAHPDAAIKLRADDTKAPIAIVSPKFADRFRQMVHNVVALDEASLSRLSSQTNLDLPKAKPENACFIIYTSGSTGKPKGVVLEHRGIATSAKYHGPLLGYEPDTRVLQFASYTFDNSLAEIFTTLMRGGCVCVPSEHERLNDLPGAINRMQVNFADLTPTVATFIEPTEVPTLKRLALGGEAVTKRCVEIWRDHASLHCCYGPSECSINSTYSGEIAQPGKATNIGRALGSVSWVVDPNDSNRLMPIGCVGELLVDGPIVSRGYLNLPEKTSESFISSPPWIRAFGPEENLPQRRIYKTGDLVRYDSDGTLMYLGRKDTQVKLNGQRIELGEIEHHIERSLPDNMQSAIELVNYDGKKALTCFVCPITENSVSNTGEESSILPMTNDFRNSAKDLEVTLSTKIPVYMVPTVWLPISSMPLTSSGKLNRRVLRTAAQAIPSLLLPTYKLAMKSGRAPSGDLEMSLAKLWAGILNTDSGAIGVEDNFFKLGGDSVGAMRLVTAARGLGISLTVASIFQKSTLLEMVSSASPLSKTNQSEIVPFGLMDKITNISGLKREISKVMHIKTQAIQDIYPCTAIQEGLMALSLKEPGAYVAQLVYQLPSQIDIAKFKQAWELVVQAEPVLRTRIIYTEKNGFLQVVLNEEIKWSHVRDLSSLSDTDRNLPSSNGGTITNYTIVGDSTGSPHFVWTVHHALYDGWSLPLVLNKVKACYEAPMVQKLHSGPSYSSFIGYLKELKIEDSDEYWLSKLSNIATQHFPKLPHPAYQPNASSMLSVRCPISRAPGSEITLATMIRAAWALIVALHSSSNDVLFWETVTGRDAPVTGIEDMMGPTLATIPTRLVLNSDMRLEDFLNLVQSQMVEAMSFQYSGVHRIRRLSPETAIACDAQNLIAINNGAKGSRDEFWIEQSNEMAGTNFYTYPLMLSCNIGEGELETDVHYDEEVIPTWLMQRIAKQFTHAVELISSQTFRDETLGAINLLSFDDHQLLVKWNGKQPEIVDKCIHHMIQDQVQVQGSDKIAVYSWDSSFSYGALDELSTRLSEHLLGHGMTYGSIVPLCFEKSAWTVVAILAVLKAGAAFVPIDPAHPEARLRSIIEDSDAKLILCSTKYEAQCSSLVPKVVPITQDSINSMKQSAKSLPPVETNYAAYVIFTSGTTGKPKGTIVEHAAFCSSAVAHGTVMEMNASSRVLQFASYTFDASIMEILTTLIMGGTVCVPSDDARLNDISGAINEMKVNWALLTPSVAQLIQPSSIPKFKTLVLGGEAMSVGHIKTWSSHVRLMNAYGPSETSVIAAINPDVTLKTGPSNIGGNVGGLNWVVDPENHDRLSPIGAVGELVVEGPILARGYLKNPQKDAEVFIKDPKWTQTLHENNYSTVRRMYKTGDLVKYTSDGKLFFLGRKDNQAKIHGQRLELSEVEHHLSMDPTIKHTMVTIPATGPCKKKLVAIMSLGVMSEVDSASEEIQPVIGDVAKTYIPKIKERISALVPPYMVPSKWVLLQQLPLLPSGKLNRRMLSIWLEQMSDMDHEKISQIENTPINLDRELSDVESKLRSIWAKVLGLQLEKIPVTQSFLQMGGDSISAMQVMASCRAENISITMPQIIQSKSIPELASKATIVEETVYEIEEVEKLFELSPIQKVFFERMGAKSTQFNQSALLKLRQRIEPRDLARALDAVVEHHSMLRARFSVNDSNVWYQRITKDIQGSYRLRTHFNILEDNLSPIIEETQKSLDIVNGPIFSVDLFEIDGGESQVVAFVAHHLIIDVVSWNILLSDLEALFQDENMGLMTSLPFQTWSSLQSDQARKLTPVFPEISIPSVDLSYWGMEEKDSIHGNCLTQTIDMDTKTTLLLFDSAQRALQSEPVDILLAALLGSFPKVFTDRRTNPVIFNEGHGREPWNSKMDLSRTIGWFTTLCPVFLPADHSNEDKILDIVRWIKDFRVKTPGKGRPYFAHRYLSSEGRDSFVGDLPAEITFNYLGHARGSGDREALFQPMDDNGLDSISSQTDIASNVPRLSLIEISASVVSSQLRLDFNFDRNMRHQSKIGQWMKECYNFIQEAVEQLSSMRPEPTLSDFPLLPLTYGGIARLEDKLPQMQASSLHEVQDVYPCSPVQQGILFTQIKNPSYYAYSVAFEAKPTMPGELIDMNRLATAWSEVCQRHSTLRTIFMDNIFQEGQMDQVVLKDVHAKVRCLDCSEEELQHIIETQPPLGMPENQPPHRLTICRNSSGKIFCVLEMSHAIADGTSMPILFRDIALAYEGTLSQRSHVPFYRDYISYIQHMPKGTGLEFWTNYLADVEPCYFPILNDGNSENRKLLSLDQSLSCASELEAFCTMNGVTLSNVLQLVWALVLQAYTGLDDVCFGYLVSGRDIPVENIDEAIGVFINMLTCRIHLSSASQVYDILKGIQADLLSSMSHQHVSLADVQHELNMSGVPLFNTAYSFQKRSVSKDLATGPLSFDISDARDPSEYDITVNVEVWESNAEVQLCYWANKISEHQAKHIATTFDHILSSIVHSQDVSCTVGSLDLLGSHGKATLVKWNYEEPEAIESCVHHVFEKNVQEMPLDSPAISAWDANFTYHELDTLAARLADHIIASGVKPSTFVPLCFEKSAWTVVAMMGVLKSGAAFVPLDSNHPGERIKYLVDSVDASVVLCSPQFEKKFNHCNVKTIVINKKVMNGLSKKPSPARIAKVSTSDAAYIIFTSGTTGLPKGTIIEHGAFTTGGIAHAKAIKMERTSRVLQFASHTFDASIMEILSCLLVGGCICIPSESDRMNDLTAVINKMNVTWTLLTPSVANVLKPGSVPNLKVLVTGGEAMSKDHILKWVDEACLVNAYGPSETSVIAATSTKVDKNGVVLNRDPACIGHAVGSRCWVVDPRDHDRLMPIGSVGELIVEGRIVAHGYLKNEQKTKDAFIDRPSWRLGMDLLETRKDRIYKTGDLVRYNSDGSLNYIGRKDTQIKLNGQRIELGEIEHHVKSSLPPDSQSAVELVVPQSKTSAKALAVFFTDDSFNDPTKVAVVTRGEIDELLLGMSSIVQKSGETLKVALETALPKYMVPSIYIPITKMPWTSSGKLDRQRLRTIVQKIPLPEVASYKLANSTKRRAPSTAMEGKLAKVWEKVLRLESGSVSKDDHFFRIGGDSITAMQLVAAARFEQITITVLNVFRHSKLSEMASFCGHVSGENQATIKSFALMKGDVSATSLVSELAETSGIKPAQIKDAYPCSSLQEGLITLSMRQEGAYVARNAFEISRTIDLERFKAAWNQTVENIDVLRSRIVHSKSNRFYQVVLQHEPIVWNIISEQDGDVDLETSIPSKNGAPLTKYTLIKNEKTGMYQFVWTIHHALYDAWSMPAILSAFESFYHGNRTSIRQPFSSFVKYLSEVDMEASDSYWKNKLDGASPSHFPPISSTASDERMKTQRVHHTTKYRKDAMSMDTTIATIVRAAWAMVIGSQSGSDDVVFGETLSGRDIPVIGIEDVCGPTLTTIPTRIQIDRSAPITEFLKQLHEQAAEVIPYQHAGLQNIKRLSQSMSVSCEFNNLLVIQTGAEPTGETLLKPVEYDLEDSFFTYPLVLECSVQRDKLDLIAHHNENVLSSWQVDRLLDQFDSLVNQLIGSSQVKSCKVGELEMCSSKDLDLIRGWNASELRHVDKSVTELILQEAQQHPDKLALCAWDGEFSYSTVVYHARHFAYYLRDLGVKPETFVPACMDKSAWTTMAMLGVLLAGGALIPLDPAHPPSRHADIVRDSNASVVICSPKYKSRFTGVLPNVVAVDETIIRQLSSVNSSQKKLDAVKGHHAAFVIYTSGSTGNPKGVVMEHRSFCASTAAYMRRMLVKPSSRVFHFTSYAFDISMGETFGTLSIGASVCIPSEEMRTGDIPGAINSLRATWAFLTPSVAKILEPEELKTLETLVCGGEALTLETVNTWANNITLMNGYGPAECTIFAVSNALVSQEKDPQNIGLAMEGNHTWIVSPLDHDYLAPVGSIGELLIEGPIVSRGYLNDPEKTAKVFIDNPKWSKSIFGEGKNIRLYKTGDLVKYQPNGSLHFVGRKDHQVKLHGQRMELGEIEHNLESDYRVKHALVILPKTGICNQRLTAVLSLHGLASKDLAIASTDCKPIAASQKRLAIEEIAAIQDKLSETLPPYMVPTTWLVVESIPLLVSGKLNRSHVQNWINNLDATTYKMASATDEEAGIKEPETSTGKLLRRIWSSVLHIPLEQTPTGQSFISLGGDSITAMQVMSQCRDSNLSLSLQEVLRSKSITHLSQVLDSQERKIERGLVNQIASVGESFELSPIQHMYFQNSTDKENGDQFNQSYLLRINSRTKSSDIDSALHAIVQKHSMFRSRFSKSQSGTWQQRITSETRSSYRFNPHNIEGVSSMVPVIGESQGSLNIKEGPLMSADLFEFKNGSQVLSIVAHHLIVDVVSWLNILRDLETYLSSGSLKLDEPLSFQTWSLAQNQNAKQAEIQHEQVLPFDISPADLEYWGMENIENVYGDTEKTSFVITDDEIITSVMGTSHKALRTEPVDVLISSLLDAFAQTFGDRGVPTLFNEGHGREPWDSSIDLSGTVGWFTALCPIQLNSSTNPADALDTLRQVKDVRRSIKGNGRPYFAYRYLTKAGKTSYGNHMPMEVSFNFLGRTQRAASDASLLEPFDFEKTQTEANIMSDVGTNTARLALFEITAGISQQGLEVSFMYSKKMKHLDRIESWVRRCRTVLEATVKQLETSKSTPTLSDIPLMPINYTELQKLVSKALPAAKVNTFDDVEDIYPCSPMQTGILLSQIKDAGRYLFHTILEVKPTPGESRLDANQLAKACSQVVQRHAGMRTVFINSVYRGGTFDQVVLKTTDPRTTVLQCREDQVVARLSAITLESTNKGSGPRLPYQFTICETPEGKVFLKLEMNHAVTDGASTSLILQDISKAYGNSLPLTDAPLYSAYIKHINNQPMETSLEFWKHYLQGIQPTDFPMINPDLAAERTLNSVSLGFNRFPELQSLCSESGVTLSNVMLTAWALVLRSYTKSEDICFGYLASGRDMPIDGVSEIFGPFINMLVFRFRFTPTMLLKSLFYEAQEDYLSSLPHQHVSLAKVQHEIGRSSRSLFNTAMSIQNSGHQEQSHEELISFESIAAHDPSEYSITLNVNTARNDEGLVFRYYTDVISDSQAEDLAKTFADLLSDFVDHANEDVSQLRLFKREAAPQLALPPPNQANMITLDAGTLQRIIAESTREAIQQLLRDGLLQNPMTRDAGEIKAAGALSEKEKEARLDVASLHIIAAKKLSDEDQLRERLAEKLMQLWKEVLGLGEYEINYQDSFFELGGDSIIAMSMVGIAREENLPLTVADVFENPTFGDMLNCMQVQSIEEFEVESSDDGTVYSETGSILVEEENYVPFSLLDEQDPETFVRDFVCPSVRVFRGGIVDVLPTTDFQALAIAGSLLDSRWMLNYFFLDGSGPLDLRLLKQSAFNLVQSFDVLRTVFIPHGKRYLQVVLRQLQPEFIVFEDVDNIETFSVEFEQTSRQEAPRLGESYVQFAVALEKDTERHRIFLRLSHAQYDGVSFPSILDALRAGYHDEPIPPTPSFAKFVRNSIGKITPDHYTYWQDLLRGSSMTNLVHRESPTYNRSAAMTKTLKQVVPVRSLSYLNITTATIVKAAWSLVLAQVTAQSDIVFGHIISGRNSSVPGIESIVGPCLNMVPVRVAYQPSWNVLELLKYVQNQQVRNMPYESLGFREIIKKCTDWNDWTNFSTVLQHQSMPQTGELAIGGNPYSVGAIASQEDFADFSVVTTPKDAESIEVCLIFAQHGAITEQFAEQIFGTFCKAIAAFSADPEAPLPSPADIALMQRQTLQDIVSPAIVEPALDAALRGLSKKELFVLSDSLGRAWNQILHDDKKNGSGDDDDDDGQLPIETPLDSSFFKLGGDIVGLAQVATILQNEGYKVKLEDLINNPTMAQQLALLSLELRREQALQSAAEERPETNGTGGGEEGRKQQQGDGKSEKKMTLWKRSAQFASRIMGRKTKPEQAT